MTVVGQPVSYAIPMGNGKAIYFVSWSESLTILAGNREVNATRLPEAILAYLTRKPLRTIAIHCTIAVDVGFPTIATAADGTMNCGVTLDEGLAPPTVSIVLGRNLAPATPITNIVRVTWIFEGAL